MAKFIEDLIPEGVSADLEGHGEAAIRCIGRLNTDLGLEFEKIKKMIDLMADRIQGVRHDADQMTKVQILIENYENMSSRAKILENMAGSES